MIPIIPSTHKTTIFGEHVPHRLADWQPSNAYAAALVCRLNAWPLWTPISESRVSDFRSRVLTTAVDRRRQTDAGQAPEMPSGLTRPEKHAVLRLGALLEPSELPRQQLTARLLTDDFWVSAEWHQMQMRVVAHFGIFATGPHLIVGASVAYAARKIGLPPPPFSESARTLPLNPMHVVALNACGRAGLISWHSRLLGIYERRVLASPVGRKTPPHVAALREALEALESVARGVLDSAIDAPKMLAAVCLESAAPPLGILESMSAAPADEMAAAAPAPPSGPRVASALVLRPPVADKEG
jgi:hypothetical protein